jgi:methylmalonyl-CoA mutase N-terminal domain/subunit
LPQEVILMSDNLGRLREAERRWREGRLAAAPERDVPFETVSGLPVATLYTPLDREGADYLAELGFPGEFPFTRGIHPNLYRGRLFTMRQFAGFGSAAETNARFRYLLEHGQSGLSVAFDMPTLMGYDSDAPESVGEVGREGVAIDTVEDMERLFQGIPLDQISVSMTINGPAAILWAMFLVVAERQGVAWDRLRGTTQADILKEYIAQKEWICPPEPAMTLLVDSVVFATRRVPLWHPISISGYHIREAGATAAEELAFTLADGFAYVDACRRAGLEVDAFAPRLSFFFNAHIDFFEEIAKYRAARRIWARHMQGQFGAKDPRSMMLRFHSQTAGSSLTAQQPEVNVVRTAYEALAAVLGGTQSLHTNALDEVWGLPTEDTARLALRTQQVLALETGVTATVDPLGGSYFVEALTDRLEAEAESIFAEIDALGGVVAGIHAGYFQRRIAQSAYRYQTEVDSGRRTVVGVNAYCDGAAPQAEPQHIDPAVEAEQVARVGAVRRRRDGAAVEAALGRLEAAARDGGPLMEALVDCARVLATEGEMVRRLQAVYGRYREVPVL